MEHGFAPVYGKGCRVLILGSFPSVRSRAVGFYYGHPQNRFWKVLSGVYHSEVPVTIEEKKAFLLKNHLAVWDVIADCAIVGSSDSSIRDVTANDMSLILGQANIRRIFANGQTAYRLFLKYCKKDGQPEVCKLPSTSPANASFSLERLIRVWRKALFPEEAEPVETDVGVRSGAWV